MTDYQLAAEIHRADRAQRMAKREQGNNERLRA